jgi:hypothetical protein
MRVELQLVLIHSQYERVVGLQLKIQACSTLALEASDWLGMVVLLAPVELFKPKQPCRE